MREISYSDAKADLDVVIAAAKDGAVVLRDGRRDVVAVVSMADYARLRAMKVQDFLRFRDEIAAEAAANGLTEEKLKRLLAEETGAAPRP